MKLAMNSSDILKWVHNYQRRRRAVRIIFLFSIAGCFVATMLSEKYPGDTAALKIIASLAAAIVVLCCIAYYLLNKCPVCRESFNKPIEKYEEGLPMFNDLELCPACHAKLK